MRYFDLLNLQHVILYVFPTLIFVILFGIGLAYTHFKSETTTRRQNEVTRRYPEGIEERDAPFPLLLILIIAGTLLWMFLYILGSGLLGVKI